MVIQLSGYTNNDYEGIVAQAKRDKHIQACVSHRFDFQSLWFSVFGSFRPAAQELPDRVYRLYRIHAFIAEWEAHAWIHRREG